MNKISKENKNYIRKRKRIDFTKDDLDEDTELLKNNEDIEFRSKSKLMRLTNSNDDANTGSPHFTRFLFF